MEGHLLSAELILRSGDWHPVEQRFTVKEAAATEEYDVLETSYQVVTLESAPPAIFAEVMPLVRLFTRRPMTATPVLVLHWPNNWSEAGFLRVRPGPVDEKPDGGNSIARILPA